MLNLGMINLIGPTSADQGIFLHRAQAIARAAQVFARQQIMFAHPYALRLLLQSSLEAALGALANENQTALIIRHVLPNARKATPAAQKDPPETDRLPLPQDNMKKEAFGCDRCQSYPNRRINSLLKRRCDRWRDRTDFSPQPSG